MKKKNKKNELFIYASVTKYQHSSKLWGLFLFEYLKILKISYLLISSYVLFDRQTTEMIYWPMNGQILQLCSSAQTQTLS